MSKTKKTTMLMILDGFGCNDNAYGNAIKTANTPNFEHLFENFPNTRIDACGDSVGLPAGQMGNSEVGHTNIGAGRIVFQDFSLINHAISDGSFFENKVLIKAIDNCINNSSTLHLIGLLSDGGVHSHINHLFALIDMAKNRGLNQRNKIQIHCFLDGRDVPPKSSLEYIRKTEEKLSKLGVGRIATIGGRYYGMDRDKHWDRIEKAYTAMVEAAGLKANSAEEAINKAYCRGETDEFVVPTVINGADKISTSDSIIMFNFRPDRARQISRCFVDKSFSEFETKKELDVSYTSMTTYDESLNNISIAYPPQSLKNTLGEYISTFGMNQLRIAETEKYAHVTFFFNGGKEDAYPSEDRILVPSPCVATYDLKPEMSAFEVTEKTIDAIGKYDLIIINFANADMVGHTGVFDAAVKAIEVLDICVDKIVKEILNTDGKLLITADHGNADVMFDESGKPVTAHSLNQVPLIYISSEPKSLKPGGKLCDIAPTLLDIMNIKKPKEMTGHSLLKQQI